MLFFSCGPFQGHIWAVLDREFPTTKTYTWIRRHRRGTKKALGFRLKATGPRPRGSVISRTISSANCIEWPSFRQSGETGTPLLSFGKKKVSKENLLTAHFVRGVVFLDSRIIKRLFARKRQRVFFWLLFFSKRKVTAEIDLAYPEL